MGIVDANLTTCCQQAEGLGGCDVIGELEIRVIEAVLGKTRIREEAFQITDVTFAGVEQPGSFVSVGKTALAEELAVCHPDRAMEKRMALTTCARPDSESGAASVCVSDGISNRHEPKIFDIIAGKKAQSGRLGKARDGVEQIRDQHIIQINSDLFVRRAHYGELREEVIVRRR